jgi:mono/diheme cytochrome c family protein
MKHIYKLIFMALLVNSISAKSLNTGDDVFREYCWGCHHQTAQAFGPSFKQIANTRTKEQIMTHIGSPKSDYRSLGYKRSVMPSFGTTLSKKELDLIVKFIYSCKDMK